MYKYGPYPECLLPSAMKNLGDMYAYVTTHWEFSLDAFQELFLSSGTAASFQAGNIELICGMSGMELANYVLWRAGLPQRDLICGPIPHDVPGYTAGRAVAMYQRISERSFHEIHRSISMSRIADLLWGVGLFHFDDTDLINIIGDELCRIESPEYWKKTQEERNK